MLYLNVIARKYPDVAIYVEIVTQFESTQITRNDSEALKFLSMG